MEDGADAVKFGLSQRATSSREEWAKRARNLEANLNYAMAAKAYRQADNGVRAAVAEARQWRSDAADGSATTTGVQRRKLLSGAAAKLLAAAARAAEAPDAVEPKEQRMWALLAAKCLSEAGDHRSAAELNLRLRRFRLALEHLSQLKNRRAEAECCMSAWKWLSASSSPSSSSATAAAASSEGGSGATDGGLLAVLGSGAVDEERQAAATKDVARQRLLRSWAVKGGLAFFDVGDHVKALGALQLIGRPDEAAAAVGKTWVEFDKAVLKMARTANVRLDG